MTLFHPHNGFNELRTVNYDNLMNYFLKILLKFFKTVYLSVESAYNYMRLYKNFKKLESEGLSMINIPNYKEFYQKALIPMNDYDRAHFCKEFCGNCQNCIKANHWLIALEGSSKESNSEKYQWKVVVYPAKETGIFWSLKVPYYQSSNPYSLTQAIEESKKIVQKLLGSELNANTMMIS